MTTRPATIADIEAELAPLQAEYDRIDIEAMTYLRDETKAIAAAYQQPCYKDGVLSDGMAESIAASAAANALEVAEIRARNLEDLMLPFKRLISAPARLDHAKSEADTAAKHIAASGDAVKVAQGTVDRLQALLGDANATYDAARADGARDLLARIKAGGTAPTATVNRDQVEALEAALSMARGELDEATAAHSLVEQEHQKAQDDLRSAQRDVSRLEWELALRDFAPVVATYRRMVDRNYLPGEDLRRHVSRVEAAAALQGKGA